MVFWEFNTKAVTEFLLPKVFCGNSTGMTAFLLVPNMLLKTKQNSKNKTKNTLREFV